MNFLKSFNISTNRAKGIDFSYVQIPKDIGPYAQEIDAKIGSVTSEKKRLISNVDFNRKPDEKELYGFSGQISPEVAGNSLITEFRTLRVLSM